VERVRCAPCSQRVKGKKAKEKCPLAARGGGGGVEREEGRARAFASIDASIQLDFSACKLRRATLHALHVSSSSYEHTARFQCVQTERQMRLHLIKWERERARERERDKREILVCLARV
jgi:hypothetical protein